MLSIIKDIILEGDRLEATFYKKKNEKKMLSSIGHVIMKIHACVKIACCTIEKSRT